MSIDWLMFALGAFFLFLGGNCIRNGVVRTRANWTTQAWYRESNPAIFWILVSIYLGIGLLFSVFGFLTGFGIIDIGKK